MMKAHLLGLLMGLILFSAGNLAAEEPGPEYLQQTMECTWHTVVDPGAGKTIPDPADPLVMLAAELHHDPVKIYNWVYENIYHPQFNSAYYYYEKSRAGALCTYLNRRGNHWDTSSLLITLFRISGIPARYVKADYDYVYVEAWLPLDSYRGKGAGNERGWAPLVPWLKDYIVEECLDLFPGSETPCQPGGKIPCGLSFDFDDYLSSVKYETPLELFEEQMMDYLNIHHPGKTLKDVPVKETLIKKPASILPGSLPQAFNGLVGGKTPLAEVPDANRTSITLYFKKATDGSTLLEYTVYFPKIAGKRFCLDWIDADIGSLKPVLRIDGEIVRGGQSGDPSLGEEESFYPSYKGAGYDEEVRRPSHQAGTFMQMAFDMLSASEKTIERLKIELRDVPSNVVLSRNTHEEYLGRMGSILTETFLSRFCTAFVRAGDLTHVKSTWNSACPTFIYALPVAIPSDNEAKFLLHPQWNIDAQTASGHYKRTNGQLEYLEWTDPLRQLAGWLAGYESSFNEARIFEDWLDTRGLSTIKGIMVANEQGITVATLTKADLQYLAKDLTFDDGVPTSGEPDFEVNNTYGGLDWYGFFRVDAGILGSRYISGETIGTYALSNTDFPKLTVYNPVIIRSGPSFDLLGCLLTSAKGSNFALSIKAFRAGVASAVYTKDVTVTTTPTWFTLGFENINRIEFSAGLGPFVLGKLSYERHNYLPALENETHNPIPADGIAAIRRELDDDATVILPTQVVHYEGMSNYVYLTHSPTGDGYLFGYVNGGQASEYVYQNPIYQPLDLNTFGYRVSPLVQEQFADIYTAGVDNTRINLSDSVVGAAVPSAGDPVNMVNGEFYQEEEPDIFIRFRGLNLSVVRKYKSGIIFNGPFGFGWTWNHAEMVLPLISGDLTYYNNECAPYNLTGNGDGTYKHPPGSTFTLVKNGDGYLVTERSLVKYYFSSQGLLTKKEDPFGNVLTFMYNARNQLTTIRDSLNRTLTFSYNPNGKVCRVTDFTNRYCEYFYDGDDLTSFVDLERNETRYEYLKNQENALNDHNMCKYILPNGDFLEIGYYKNDQVAYHRNKKGETFNFQYSRLNRYGETWNEAGYYRKVFFNENHDVIRVANEDRTVEQMGYDEHHNMIWHIDANGHKTTFDYGPDPSKRNLHSKKNALGEQWTYAYDSPYNPYAPTEEWDTEAHITKYEYNPNGSLHVKTEAPGYQYDADWNLVANAGAPGFKTTYQYNAFGGLVSVTDPLGKAIVNTYDVWGLDCKTITDKNGYITGYTYYRESNPDGMPVGTVESVTVKVGPDSIQLGADPLGYTTFFGYNHYNQRTDVTDPLGNTILYEYDRNRKPTKTIEPNGAITENVYGTARDIVSGAQVSQAIDLLGNSEFYSYDEVGNMISKTDRNGNVTSYFYDGLNRLIEEIDPYDNSIRYDYDGNGNLVKKTDRRDNATSYEYDKANRLTKKTGPEGNTATYEYYPDGQLRKEIHSINETGKSIQVVTHYEYNALNHLISKTVGYGRADSRVYRYRYDALGLLRKAIDPEGNYEKHEYDGNGNRTKSTYYDKADSKLREVAYVYYEDSRNLLKDEIVDNGKDGKKAGNHYEYDAVGRKTAYVDPEKNRTEYAYDPVGNLIGGIDPLGNVTQHFYSLAKQRVKTIDALNQTSVYRYDKNGNPILVIDEEGNETATYYDALNLKIGAEDASGALTIFDYDANENLICVTDPNDGSALYAYDKNNRQTKVTRPMGKATAFKYDAIGNCTQVLDAKGQKITYEYNILNLPASVEYFAAASTTPARTVGFAYNRNGALSSYDVDGSVAATYSYDGLGRKTQESVIYEPFTLKYNYEYPNAWERTFAGPDKTAITYKYDGAYRLRSVQIPGQGEISYDDYRWNSPGTAALPGGSTVKYGYDPLMQLASIQAENPGHSTMMNRVYVYSPAGNIEKKNTEHGNYVYQYDNIYRLETATNPSPLSPEAYTYDDLGNRVTASDVPGNWVYNKNNELSSYNGVSFIYDDNGNMTKKTVGPQYATYDYNVEDRLEVVKDKTGTVIGRYGYDPFGRRLWKEVAGVKTYFFYSDEGLIGEYDASGSEIRSYGYVLGSEWTTAPLYQKTVGVYYWYLNDHLGTPQKIVDNSGAVVWSAVYDSFGNVQIDTQSITNNLRFPGQYYDAETGLHYNFHRYYDPKLGRYLRVDPEGDGLNLYAYVRNNPLRYLDPRGLCARMPYFWDTPKVYDNYYASQLQGSTVQSLMTPVPTLPIYETRGWDRTPYTDNRPFYFDSAGYNASLIQESTAQSLASASAALSYGSIENTRPVYTDYGIETHSISTNVYDLGRILATECSAGLANNAERTGVGSTVITRMERNGTLVAADVWGAYGYDKKPSDRDLVMADDLLSGRIRDNTGGATHYYSPWSMPKEGGELIGDTRGGLEHTPGLKQGNYKPSWSLTFQPIQVPEVRGKFFKFYKQPGSGRVY